MKIKDFIRKFENVGVYPNVKKMMERYNIIFQRDGSWMDFDVDFYILLIDEPLWKFNELYNKWYEAKRKINEAGAMGDFMGDEPTDEQIEDYINGKEVDFE